MNGFVLSNPGTTKVSVTQMAMAVLQPVLEKECLVVVVSRPVPLLLIANAFVTRNKCKVPSFTVYIELNKI